MSAPDLIAALFTALALVLVAWMAWQLRAERRDVAEVWGTVDGYARSLDRRERDVRRREWLLLHTERGPR